MLLVVWVLAGPALGQPVELERHLRGGVLRAIWLVAAALLVVVAIGALYMRRPSSSGRLIFLEGRRQGESVVLGKPQLSIGALPDNDIVVPSPAVSRYHAPLQCRGRYVGNKDIGSSNGRFVNGTNVRSCPLEPGDTVRIGDVDLQTGRFVREASSE